MAVSGNKKATTGRRVDLSVYAASFFAPHLFCGDARARLGCGATALALITGVAPEIIASRNRGAHYSDRFMIRFLRAAGFRTLHLTEAILGQSRPGVGSGHVVLVSQLFTRGEGTWGVVFGDAYYHNFDILALSALAFLNKPIMSAYLVIHPEWRIENSAGKRPPKLPAKSRRLALASLRKHAEFTFIRAWK